MGIWSCIGHIPGICCERCDIVDIPAPRLLLTLPYIPFEPIQATRRLVVETALRKKMGVAARESAWKFERNIILQQMAENYKVRSCVFRIPFTSYL